MIVLRQSGADPEKGEPSRKDLIWFTARNIEHFRDRMEFCSGGSRGEVLILPSTGEDYVIGTPAFHRKHKLAGSYEFLIIYPMPRKHYPEHLHINPLEGGAKWV